MKFESGIKIDDKWLTIDQIALFSDQQSKKRQFSLDELSKIQVDLPTKP